MTKTSNQQHRGSVEQKLSGSPRSFPVIPIPLPWELFASRGHVMLAKLQVLSKYGYYPDKGLEILCAGICGLLVVIGGVWFAQGRVEDVGASLSAKLVRLVSDVGTESPSLQALAPKIENLAPDQISKLSSIPDAMAWVDQSLIELNKSGATPKYCATTLKITENWLVGDGSSPNCRVGKRNIWVWAPLKKGSDEYAQVVPLAGVFHKNKRFENAWEFNVIADAGVTFPQYRSIELTRIPRAVAEDLPELVASHSLKGE